MPVPTPPISPWGDKVFPPSWPLSIWQKTTRDDPLVNMGRDEPLPESADVVIIGSGLAGTKTAHSLLTSTSRPSSVVVLEAREACSGASGRNAGHCRPDAFRGFTAFSKIHGKEEAAKILKSEAITLDKVKEFIAEHKVECEFTPRKTLDVVLNEEFRDYCAVAWAEAEEYGLDLSGIKRYDSEEARKLSRSPTALGAYEWDAASINPSQLCYGVHRVNLALGGYKLFTWTPVTAVTEAEAGTVGGGEYKWKVQTPRGSVLAKKVVFATNGYTSLVMPEMEGLITSLQAQAMKLDLPPVGIDTFPRIEPTMSLRYLAHFYSVMQRPDNSFVIAAPRRWPGQSDETFAALLDTYDDSFAPTERAHSAFSAFAGLVPGAGYNADRLVPGEGGFDWSWTGILGLTPDTVPFVGPVPGKEGQYIIAGFNGHGMARIFHVAPCLAGVMLGEEWDETVPLVFKSSEERFTKLRKEAASGKKQQWSVLVDEEETEA